MRSLTTLLLLLLLSGFLTAQSSLAEILRSSNDFNSLVERGEAYFRQKHNNTPFNELGLGVNRDGEFVKFMRWRKFWQDRLNPDGTLGDISAYGRKRVKRDEQKSSNPYANVPWTNISYEDYIISQIGLGRTTSMVFHPTNPNVFYVGAAIGGVWKTTDGGQSYVPIGDNLPFLAVSSLVLDGNTLYVAVSDHVWYGPPSIGVYKTDDDGQNWEPTALSFDFTSDRRIYWMEQHPGAPKTILVGTQAGLYKTTDGFSSVTSVSNSNTFSVRYKTDDANVVFQGTSNGQLRRSTNGGNSFSTLHDFGNGNVYIILSPTDGDKVFVRNNETLYRSYDGGLTFDNGTPLPENNQVVLFAPTDDEILLSGNFETHRSDDGGDTFSATSQWLGNNGLPDIHVDQRNMFFNPLEPNAVYYTNDGGVYRYLIAQGQFENLSNGLAITQFYDIAIAQSDPAVLSGGSQDNGNVFRGSNGSWMQHARTGDGMNQDIDPTDANVRYWSYQYGAMRRWENGFNRGIAPLGQDGNGAWETPFKLDPSNPSRLIVGYDRVYASNDRGNSWTDISGSLANGGDLNELAIAPSAPERIYATRGGTLYVRDPNSLTWSSKSLPGPVSDLEVDFNNDQLIYVTVPGYSSGQKVFRSADAGDNWENISGSLANVSTGALELLQGSNHGIFVGNDYGVFYRDDNNPDWLQYGQLPSTRVEDIEIQISAQLIRIGTHGRGVLEAPIDIQTCSASSADGDNDGVCDLFDACPGFDDGLIGTPCEDGDPYSSGERFTTNCACEGGMANLEYCAAAGSPGTGSDYINLVNLHTIQNSSGKTAYSDFRSISTELEQGRGYPIEVRLAAVFPPDRVLAWIDYNRDGQFSTEESIPMSVPDSGTRTSSGTVTVPVDAGLGATTLRVRVVYSTTFDSPCGDAFGEVEDYTVWMLCGERSTNTACTGLPLEWVAFLAERQSEKSARLSWTTSQEEGLDKFQVERSEDGIAFDRIARVTARNLSEEGSYVYVDENIQASGYYYRIQALEHDGSSSLTEVKRVLFPSHAKASFYLTPNPADDFCTLNWRENAGPFTWQLWEVNGKMLRTQRVTDSQPGSTRIPLDDLPPGMYLLKVKHSRDTETLTLIKQ